MDDSVSRAHGHGIFADSVCGGSGHQTNGVELVPQCDLCGSLDSEHLLVNRDRLFGLPGEFGLVRCTDCGLVRLSPRPARATLPSYYPEGYYAHDEPEIPGMPGSLPRIRQALRAAGLSSLGYDVESHARWSRILARRPPALMVRFAGYGNQGFPRSVKGGRALEVGCGNGSFLHLLQRHGWDVEGVDISPAAAHMARSAYGIEVHVGELSEAPLSKGGFDFIYMSHVIEHVVHPVATLKRVAELLRPGGRVYVETPNIESTGFSWCREYWFPLETPRHLWLFSPSTLLATLSRAGLGPQRLSTRGFRGTYPWDATYRQEERTGQRLAHRPAVRARSWPRAASLTAASHLARWTRPNLGDILCCWAGPTP